MPNRYPRQGGYSEHYAFKMAAAAALCPPSAGSRFYADETCPNAFHSLHYGASAIGVNRRG